jgi:hypothetical protein
MENVNADEHESASEDQIIPEDWRCRYFLHR